MSRPPLVMPRRSATCLTPRYSVAIVAPPAREQAGKPGGHGESRSPVGLARRREHGGYDGEQHAHDSQCS
ncbi:hypothetical protein BBNG_00840 [Bifidobacterium bifidum NCIMB 41171]|nr:hypothetical protein BBNG_00840 [Bifidobacterium bifidum NCIMB 41171]